MRPVHRPSTPPRTPGVLGSPVAVFACLIGRSPVRGADHGGFSTTTVVVYQASGDPLLWLEEDNNSLWFGPLEQQPTNPTFPLAKTRH